MSNERYQGARDDEELEVEDARLRHLAASRDPKSRALIEQCGIAAGWHCLELGAGAGTMAVWMSEQVGPEGRVLSTDIDLRHHEPVADNVEVRRHDVTTEPLPDAHFDLIHARAVMQHLPERDEVLDKLLVALKPGGWLVIEDGDFHLFGEQTLPEPYQTVHKIISGGQQTPWRDSSYGGKLLAAMSARGLTDLDLVGDVWTMRPGESGGEWWFLAVERAGPRLVEAGVITQDVLDRSLAQIREPGFAMMSTVSIGCIGRKPTD